MCSSDLSGQRTLPASALFPTVPQFLPTPRSIPKRRLTGKERAPCRDDPICSRGCLRLCAPWRKAMCLCTWLLGSEQPCEADQIPWMGGKGVGSLGMAGPNHNHGAFDVQMNGTSRLLPSAVPIFFWERELTHPGYAVFVMLHGMSCFDLPKKKGSVPTPILLGTRLKYMKGVHMRDFYETTMGE